MAVDQIDIDGALGQIRDAVETAFKTVGSTSVDIIRELVSVDVEYSGNVVVIRSAPGEPPRRETGLLQDSMQYATDIDTSGVHLNVFSDIFYSVHLEFGHDNVAPRPHWQPLYSGWPEYVLQTVADQIQQIL